MYIACQGGHLDIIKLLQEHGASFAIVSKVIYFTCTWLSCMLNAVAHGVRVGRALYKGGREVRGGRGREERGEEGESLVRSGSLKFLLPFRMDLHLSWKLPIITICLWFSIS